jgi:hypothetical protein
MNSWGAKKGLRLVMYAGAGPTNEFVGKVLGDNFELFLNGELLIDNLCVWM